MHEITHKIMLSFSGSLVHNNVISMDHTFKSIMHPVYRGLQAKANQLWFRGGSTQGYGIGVGVGVGLSSSTSIR